MNLLKRDGISSKAIGNYCNDAAALNGVSQVESDYIYSHFAYLHQPLRARFYRHYYFLADLKVENPNNSCRLADVGNSFEYNEQTVASMS